MMIILEVLLDSCAFLHTHEFVQRASTINDQYITTHAAIFFFAHGTISLHTALSAEPTWPICITALKEECRTRYTGASAAVSLEWLDLQT